MSDTRGHSGPAWCRPFESKNLGLTVLDASIDWMEAQKRSQHQPCHSRVYPKALVLMKSVWYQQSHWSDHLSGEKHLNETLHTWMPLIQSATQSAWTQSQSYLSNQLQSREEFTKQGTYATRSCMWWRLCFPEHRVLLRTPQMLPAPEVVPVHAIRVSTCSFIMLAWLGLLCCSCILYDRLSNMTLNVLFSLQKSPFYSCSFSLV
jgi:hypothetical protein